MKENADVANPVGNKVTEEPVNLISNHYEVIPGVFIIYLFIFAFHIVINLGNLLWVLFQFPGGSDNFLPISGEGHPFLSSSEVPLHSTYSLRIQDAEVLCVQIVFLLLSVFVIVHIVHTLDPILKPELRVY